MARLEPTATAGAYFSNFLSKAGRSLQIRGSEALTSALLKNAGISDDTDSPIGDRVLDGLSSVGNLLSGRIAMNELGPDTHSLHRPFPGFLAEYKNGGLYNIFPFQFEPVITSDNRTAEFSEVDYGVNSLHTFKKVSLRKITMETYFATLDSIFYTSHYVETKVRALQSMLYPAETFTQANGDGANTLLAPSIIGLFIGDKFMRRRLPRIQPNKDSDSEALTVIKKALSNDFLNDLVGFTLTAEPIKWRVADVSVEWAEAPSNLNHSELSYNFVPGQSKLPMFQKVTVSLEEHRAPNTYETDRDAAAFTGLLHPNSAAAEIGL